MTAEDAEVRRDRDQIVWFSMKCCDGHAKGLMFAQVRADFNAQVEGASAESCPVMDQRFAPNCG